MYERKASLFPHDREQWVGTNGNKRHVLVIFDELINHLYRIVPLPVDPSFENIELIFNFFFFCAAAYSFYKRGFIYRLVYCSLKGQEIYNI